MRLRHVKNADLIIDSNPDYCIKSPLDNKGKWLEIYDKFDRIELEIGCGKGKFLLEKAKLNKNTLYIGMEKMSSVICRAIEKIKESETKNVIFILGDATNLLDYFSESEIDGIYLNFSDPWPKARHEKRRLTYQDFLKKYAFILKEDGYLKFKTDNFDLYQYSLEQLKNCLTDLKNGLSERVEGEPETEFETKFRDMGNKIYYICGKFRRDFKDDFTN